MSDENQATDHIESQFREARGYFTDFRNKVMGTEHAHLADGLILLVDGLQGVAQKLDKIQATLDMD